MRVRRSVGTLCLGVLLLRAFVPGAMHACPSDEHRSSPVAAAASVSAHVGHAGHDAGAEPGEHAGHVEHHEHAEHVAQPTAHEHVLPEAPTEPVSPTVPSDCACASWCCCAPAFAHLPVMATVASVVVAVPVERIASVVTDVHASRHDRRLPFANAPPSV
jgi:hypothetical protein